MRIGLVLGAGAYPGHAWHVGVLHGIEDALGWDARDAEVIVGTSIGSITGGGIRGGFAIADLAAAILGTPKSQEGERLSAHHIDPPHMLPPDVGPLKLPAPMPSGIGALRAIATLDDERHVRSLVMQGVAGLVPKGRGSLAPVGHSIDTLLEKTWPERDLWVVATRVRDGARVVFGRDGSPIVSPGVACAASGSIPGVFKPVEIEGEFYVDAGIGSTTNADLLRDRDDLDLVVVSAPLASAAMFPTTLDAPVRVVTSAQIRHEVRGLRDVGHHVVTISPSSRTARAMGTNPLVDDREAQGWVYTGARAEARAAMRGFA